MSAMLGKAAILLLALLGPVACDAPKPQLESIQLQCAGGDCPLLNGAPQTFGMRSGFVRLSPGKSVGWHSTKQNEEALVILRGTGSLLIQDRPPNRFMAPHFFYVPADTKHNVVNTGREPLEYVYVVGPVVENKGR